MRAARYARAMLFLLDPHEASTVLTSMQVSPLPPSTATNAMLTLKILIALPYPGAEKASNRLLPSAFYNFE